MGDAVPAQHLGARWKTKIAVVGVLMFTFRTMQYQFLVPEEDDYVVYLALTGSAMSVQSLIASFSRILAIFMGKQAVLALFRKDRCLSIRYAPFIQWEDGEFDREAMKAQ